MAFGQLRGLEFHYPIDKLDTPGVLIISTHPPLEHFHFRQISFLSLNYHISSLFFPGRSEFLFSTLNFAKHSDFLPPSISISLCLLWPDQVLNCFLLIIGIFSNLINQQILASTIVLRPNHWL